MHRSVLAPKHCSPKIDLFHQTAAAVDHSDVIDAYLIFHHEEKPAQDILDDALRSKSDGDSSHACAGKQRPDIEIHFLKDHERSDSPNESEYGLSCQAADGFGAFLEFVFATAACPQHHSDGVVSQTAQCPAYNGSADVG